MPGRLTHREYTALAIVSAGHLLLIAAFVFLSESEKRKVVEDHRNAGVLRLIEAKPLASEPRTEAPSVAPIRSAPIVVSEPSARAITAPAERGTSPPLTIDWSAEAEQSARAAAEQLGQEKHRPLGPRPQVPAAKPPPEFEWDPEPGTAGFSGLLPFVRLGKRCVVGLGFFACGIGKLPEPNGELFKGMRDPNRPESSVPDPP